MKTRKLLFAEYLRALYTSRPVDLIVAIGAPAAAFVQRYRQRLFPATPMVFTAVEQRRVQYEKLTENDTVVAVAHDFPAAFDNILRVLPLTKTIAVVNGASPNETFWLEEMRRELAPLTGRVELRWYNEKSFEEILVDAARLPPHSAIFWHLMNVDAAGVAHEANDALNKLSSSANAPIFSYDGSFFGEAIVGGPMHSVHKLGQITAAVAVRILNGEKAGDIKTPPTGSQRPYSTGDKCSAGELPRAICRPAATSTSGSQRCGSGIRGRSRSSPPLFSCKLDLSRRCYMSIVGVNLPKVAMPAAHGRTGPCHPLLDSWRTDRLDRSRNQSAAWRYPNQRRNRTGNSQIRSPDIAELNEIVGDIVQDDRRASEVIRRMRSLVKKTAVRTEKPRSQRRRSRQHPISYTYLSREGSNWLACSIQLPFRSSATTSNFNKSF